MKEIFVFEVMSENVITCSPESPLKDVVKILSRDRLSSLVITVDEEPVGIITERDLVSILDDMLNEVVWDKTSIENFMTTPTYTIRGDVALHKAVKFTKEKDIRHLPVVNKENKLIGILTQTDLVNGLSKLT